MPLYTCGIGGERAEERTIMQSAGPRRAIVCPTHGLLAMSGFKPATGTSGTRDPDGSDPSNLPPGNYCKVGNRWWANPPTSATGGAFLVGMPVTVNADTTLTVNGYIDGDRFKGWLEAGVWLAEQT